MMEGEYAAEGNTIREGNERNTKRVAGHHPRGREMLIQLNGQ